MVHPQQIQDFPYPVTIKVKGEPRIPMSCVIDGRPSMMVELNPEETYEVHLGNLSSRPVFAAVYVDGVGSIDGVRAEPAQLPSWRHWHLTKRVGRIRGWTNIPRDAAGRPTGPQQVLPFQVVPRDSSVAMHAGFDQNVGMITVIFYTSGIDGVQQPTPQESRLLAARGSARSDFGTGAGAASQASLDFFQGGDRPALMLAAVTYHYRSRDEIASMSQQSQLTITQGPGDDELTLAGSENGGTEDEPGRQPRTNDGGDDNVIEGELILAE